MLQIVEEYYEQEYEHLVHSGKSFFHPESMADIQYEKGQCECYLNSSLLSKVVFGKRSLKNSILIPNINI